MRITRELMIVLVVCLTLSGWPVAANGQQGEITTIMDAMNLARDEGQVSFWELYMR